MKDSRLAREEGVFAEGTPQWMSRKDWCMVGESLQRTLQGLLENCPCSLLCFQKSIHSLQRLKLSARELIPQSRQAGLCSSAQLARHPSLFGVRTSAGRVGPPSSSACSGASACLVSLWQFLLMWRDRLVWSSFRM